MTGNIKKLAAERTSVIFCEIVEGRSVNNIPTMTRRKAMPGGRPKLKLVTPSLAESPPVAVKQLECCVILRYDHSAGPAVLSVDEARQLAAALTQAANAASAVKAADKR